MDIKAAIKRPELLHIQTETGVAYGMDQEWYQIKWRRMAGCGPVAATTQLLYLNERARLGLPYQNLGKQKVTAAMKEVWRFVTPTLGGLHTLDMFTSGILAIAKRYKIDLSCRALQVGRDNRPQREEVLAFIAGGLDSDVPVAFLNLHNGGIEVLDTWHWVSIVAIDGENITFYDQGGQSEMNIAQWLARTKIGGGFAYTLIG